MYDYRRGGGVFGAFILGGLIGAVLGLLFAPRSGKETREMLADTAEDYWNQGKDLYETGVTKVTEVYSTGKETATAKSEELRDKIDEARTRLKQQVGSVAESARAKVEKAVPATKEAVEEAGEAAKAGIDEAEKKAQGTLDVAADTATKKGEAPGAGGSKA